MHGVSRGSIEGGAPDSARTCRSEIVHLMTTSDAVRIAYYIDDFTDPWTKPQTLFVLHSGMSSARRLYAMVPHLARKYRVVRVDLRGHGNSEVPPPDQPLTLERLTRDLLELLDQLQVEKAHFLGVS